VTLGARATPCSVFDFRGSKLSAFEILISRLREFMTGVFEVVEAWVCFFDCTDGTLPTHASFDSSNDSRGFSGDVPFFLEDVELWFC